MNVGCTRRSDGQSQDWIIPVCPFEDQIVSNRVDGRLTTEDALEMTALVFFWRVTPCAEAAPLDKKVISGKKDKKFFLFDRRPFYFMVLN